MIQIFFVLSGLVFFLIRLALGLFFLKDARIRIREKNFQNGRIVGYLLFSLELCGSVLLVLGAFTQIAALLLILFLIISRSMRSVCSFPDSEVSPFFALLLLLVLLTTGGGVLSVDNMLQIVIY